MPLDTGRSRLLAEATIVLPAAEDGHVWLIAYPGGGIGQGTPTYRLVDLDGNTVIAAPGLEPLTYYPAMGVEGGLALEYDEGVAVWDAATGEVQHWEADGPGHVADTVGSTVIWCTYGCAHLRMTELGVSERTVSPPGGREAFDPRAAALSPDGRLLAAVAGDAAPLDPGSTGTLVVVDRTSGDVLASAEVPRPTDIAWTPDGSQLFFSGSGSGASGTAVGRYDRGSARMDHATLPLDAQAFVPLSRGDAAAFLDGADRLE